MISYNEFTSTQTSLQILSCLSHLIGEQLGIEHESLIYGHSDVLDKAMTSQLSQDTNVWNWSKRTLMD